MGFNMYKQIPMIKETLKEQGHKKDIPIHELGNVLMILYGMKKTTAIKWIYTFEKLDLLTVKDNLINFKEE